ncbi:alpha-ribazole phosphatase [Natronospora cellulosivora (SeqCode)]
MRLLLLRHVETKANSDKKYIGHSTSEYTAKGQKDIAMILEFLAKEDFDKIYSSPLPRTVKLAELISKKYDRQLIVDETLKEMNFGIFEGKTYQELEKEYQNQWQKWTKDYLHYRIPEGESCMDVYQRVSLFIDNLKSNKEEKLLIITHGGIIQTFITYLLDLEINDRWHFKISPAGMVDIEYKNDFGVINRIINDI